MDLRTSYEHAVRHLKERVVQMRKDGASTETIARAIHAERLRLSTRCKALTPEPYQSRIRERTIRVYGNEHGPSIEFLRAKNKSWDAIIDSATRPGPPVGLDREQSK